MPETTEQVEGGGSKGVWPDGTTGSKTASFCIACGLLEVQPARTCFNEGKEAEFTDIEVIPVSALLSDEVVGAVLVDEAFQGEFSRAFRSNEPEVIDEAAAYLLRASFQAAIDHLGGTDVH